MHFDFRVPTLRSTPRAATTTTSTLPPRYSRLSRQPLAPAVYPLRIVQPPLEDPPPPRWGFSVWDTLLRLGGGGRV
jgi:hypothetical protein